MLCMFIVIVLLTASSGATTRNLYVLRTSKLSVIRYQHVVITRNFYALRAPEIATAIRTPELPLFVLMSVCPANRQIALSASRLTIVCLPGLSLHVHSLGHGDCTVYYLVHLRYGRDSVHNMLCRSHLQGEHTLLERLLLYDISRSSRGDDRLKLS